MFLEGKESEFWLASNENLTGHCRAMKSHGGREKDNPGEEAFRVYVLSHVEGHAG